MSKTKHPKTEKVLLSTREAAELMGLQPQTLRRWAIYENGPVSPIRYGRLLRWSKKEILKFARESI
ncbi:helix-turn-helix domain-containing protein [Acinetobacter junii]|uniref:helix-turn-helix domain-containing protein n=1 Tax=Acinetobacter junii TaxID=40215 RepID=UPI0022EA4C16|nr:helix-turn-helix domain-containing protein [Acinetobacter junii]MDA3509408.1 helix-turn-helix domain-containing protein [Acinetobacter junii]MDA3533910.1 helix-turn-helix domain-containing protein [Acinetobacter junii]